MKNMKHVISNISNISMYKCTYIKHLGIVEHNFHPAKKTQDNFIMDFFFSERTKQKKKQIALFHLQIQKFFTKAVGKLIVVVAVACSSYNSQHVNVM